MIKVKNERSLLPIIRNPLSNWSSMQEEFIPIWNLFLASEAEKDEYHGYTFSITFLKNTHVEYHHILSMMNMQESLTKNNWIFAPFSGDRNKTIWKENNAIVVIHQEKWLWFE